MTCIDIHLSIDPMYLNLAVLFISECPLHFFGKSVSVINSTLLAKKIFAFNTHVVELIYTYHMPLFAFFMNHTLEEYIDTFYLYA